MVSNKKIVVYLNSNVLSKLRLIDIYDTVKRYGNSILIIENCTDEIVEFFNKYDNIKVVDVKCFITAEFLGQIEEYSIMLSKAISNTNRDYLYYKNINLGDVIDHSLYANYFDILEDLFILNKVIGIEKPDVMIKYSDYDEYSKEIKELLEKKFKIMINIVDVNYKKKLYALLKNIVRDIVNILSLAINVYTIKDRLKYFLYYRKNLGDSGESEVKHSIPLNQFDGFRENVKPLFAIDNPNSSCIDTVKPLFRKYKFKSVITDNIEVVKKISKAYGCRILYLPLHKQLLNIRYLAYIFHMFNMKREFKNRSLNIEGHDLYPFLLKNMKNIFLKYFPQILSSLVAMERIFKNQPNNIVVMPTQCSEFDEGIIKMASNYKVPSIVLQHGIAGRAFGFIPIISTRVALWGERDKLFFERNHADMEKVTVIGCPRFDNLIDNSFDYNEILKRNNLQKKNVILVATTQLFAEFQKSNHLIIEVIKLLGSYEKILFIIKPHPSEDASKYKRMLFDLNIKNGVIIEAGDINELIFISNLVVTYPSTVPLHAMLLKKPTVILGENTIYSKYPELVNVFDINEVYTKLKPLLVDKPLSMKVDYEGILNEYFYKSDGKATDRAVELINQVARMKQGPKFGVSN